MRVTDTEPLAAFLAASHYCEVADPEVASKALEIASSSDSPRETAVRLFRWIRDEITYQAGHWNRTASQTLREKRGTCTTKTNLLVAMLRSQGIPAGYGMKRVNGRDYFGHLLLPTFRRHISADTRHFYTYVYLEDRWIRCDPTDDRQLSIGTHHINPQGRLVEWDGTSNAELNLDPSHVLEDVGPLPDIDSFMARPARKRSALLAAVATVYLEMGNTYLDFLRERGHLLKSVDEAGLRFNLWLIPRRPSMAIVLAINRAWRRAARQARSVSDRLRRIGSAAPHHGRGQQ